MNFHVRENLSVQIAQIPVFMIPVNFLAVAMRVVAGCPRERNQPAGAYLAVSLKGLCGINALDRARTPRQGNAFESEFRRCLQRRINFRLRADILPCGCRRRGKGFQAGLLTQILSLELIHRHPVVVTALGARRKSVPDIRHLQRRTAVSGDQFQLL